MPFSIRSEYSMRTAGELLVSPATALIGVAGAIGAAGGVLVNLAFRQSFLAYKTGDGAYIAFLAFYAVCFAVTWFVYLRKAHHLSGV